MLYLFKLFSNCIFKVTLVLMIHILYAHTNKYLFLYVFLLSQWRYIGAPKIYVYREKENFCEWRKVGFLFKKGENGQEQRSLFNKTIQTR